MAILLLASGAVALAYRYRFEYSHGPAILRATTVFAVLAGAFLVGLVVNRLTSVPLMIFGSLSIVASAIAVLTAWASDPCRYQRCAPVGRDDGFMRWWAVAAALFAASLWTAYFAATPERRARWGLRLTGVVFSMLLAAIGALSTSSPRYHGGFWCGPLLPYDAPTPTETPDPTNPC